MKDTVKRFNSSLKAMVSDMPCAALEHAKITHTHSSITFPSLLHQLEKKETDLLATNVSSYQLDGFRKPFGKDKGKTQRASLAEE